MLALGGLLLAASLAGAPLSEPRPTAIFCLLLLLIGLPHGALDIERLKQAHGAGWSQVVGLFALYLGLAAVMLTLWLLSPVLAMGLFLLTAVMHFAEDWPAMAAPILRFGMAAALLCMPALLYKAELGAIFAVVTGAANGALLAELMRALAPVALALAVIGLVSLSREGLRVDAGCGAMLLATMLLAPPIAGFALFFCVFHSPRHLAEAWQALSGDRKRLLGILLALTGGAMALAALMAGLEVRDGLPARLVAATFMTFSILTVPHMLVPPIVARLRGRAHGFAEPRSKLMG